jgi:methionyl-tRNA formyltransferase
MDAGDILASASTPIGPAETAGELHDRLADLGSPLLPKVLDEMAAGTLHRTPQDHAAATRARKLSREIAWVDFTQPAPLVSARIRGMSPWPGIQVEFIDSHAKPRTQATILKCRVTPSNSPHASQDCGKVLPDRSIACGIGSLEILTIQPAGKKPMDLQPFANGYGLSTGAHFKSVVAPQPS